MADTRKRVSSSDQVPWQRQAKDHRRNQAQVVPKRFPGSHGTEDEISARKEQEDFVREQTRLNQVQEAERMREWVSKEDDFVLQQSKKKAHIRVKEGRAKTIDWLVVTLGVIDPTKDPLEEDDDEPNIDLVDPTAIFEGLTLTQLQELSKDIDTYLMLETNGSNRRYWNVIFLVLQANCALADNHRR